MIATSLTAWEILRAKMLAAIWRARNAGLMLIALWVVGLVAGAVHPLGFLNAVAGLIAIGAFYAAVGVSLSLQIGERKQANNMILLACSVRAAPERAGDLVAGQCERLAGGVLVALSHLVVAVLLRRRPVRGPLGRDSAIRRDQHQTRRERPDGAGRLLVCHDRARGRSLLPHAHDVPEV